MLCLASEIVYKNSGRQKKMSDGVTRALHWQFGIGGEEIQILLGTASSKRAGKRTLVYTSFYFSRNIFLYCKDV